MIIGKAEIKRGRLKTSNDSYPINDNTTFSVQRPFRESGIIIAVLLMGFSLAFWDLLFWWEQLLIGGCAVVLVLIGVRLAHLTIVSRDLAGSPLSVAVWGTYADLNRKLDEIADTLEGEM